MGISCTALPNGDIQLKRIEGQGEPFNIVLSIAEAHSLIDQNRLAFEIHKARQITASARNTEISKCKAKLADLEREEQLSRMTPKQREFYL